MIPSIKTIAEDLAAGRITTAQAIAWLYQHTEGATDDLRDHFAAQAIIAYHSDGNFSSPEDAANWCYSMADAMLEARK